MKNNHSSYPALETLQILFQDPSGSWKKIHRAASFRELLIHYMLPFYLITLIGGMLYYLIAAKSPLQALIRGASGPFLFFVILTLSLKITGMALAAGVSHFGVRIKEITGHNLIVFAALPSLALSPFYFLGLPGKVIMASGIFFSFILVYYGSRFYLKTSPETEKTLIISVYSFILVFFIVFFAGYLALAHFVF